MDRSHESAPDLDETPFLEPSAADIEAWAAQERRRREAWLQGPTEEQKAAWARRERDRRLAELEGTGRARRPGADPARLVQRSLRQAQLATEGALSLLFRMSPSDVFEQLVRAGRAWEEEFTSPPARRRVALPAEAEAEPEPGPGSARPSAPPEVPPRPD
jgi:hypothetical protein